MIAFDSLMNDLALWQVPTLVEKFSDALEVHMKRTRKHLVPKLSSTGQMPSSMLLLLLHQKAFIRSWANTGTLSL
jgi:hypothetical protein